MKTSDDRLRAEFAAHCREARASLRKHMAESGLHEADGWGIYEFTRDLNGRTELVMRPLHARLKAPAGLECSCWVDEDGADTSAECR